MRVSKVTDGAKERSDDVTLFAPDSPHMGGWGFKSLYFMQVSLVPICTHEFGPSIIGALCGETP